ncbi:glycerate kinase [Kineothrix sedimenti]|uniref:Glycerate kinase n=1 Tax=Kineothrix sedimenti TaxID=3123317 RepID=A0ABZ3EXM9_9FIRM
MRILIASDSFKGSLSSAQVAENIKAGILGVYSDAEIKYISVADGGEGTVEAVISGSGGKMVNTPVMGPDGKMLDSFFGILEDGSAIIEMAAASGLPLVPERERDIMKATTYGTGQLLKAAMDNGCMKIYIGVGGSATNDGGIGMAQALGASFKDDRGEEVGFGGGQLSRIAKIDVSRMDERLRRTEIIVMSDVTNPLCGPSGASAVYGPQKGASPEQVVLLDEGLSHLAKVIEETLTIDIRNMKGAGAAGGLGGGLAAFTGAVIRSGIDAVLDMSDFAQKAEWADLIITGEGRIDFQSSYGKVISGIAGRAGKYGVPIAAIAGSLSEGSQEVYKIGISCMEAAVCRPMPLEEAMGEKAGELVADAAERLMRGIKVGTMQRDRACHECLGTPNNRLQ